MLIIPKYLEIIDCSVQSILDYCIARYGAKKGGGGGGQKANMEIWDRGHLREGL